MKSLSLRCAPLVAALGTLLASPAFANSMSGNVTANVASTCEIRAVTDVHADFEFSVSSSSRTGQILVICNKDANYTLTSPTVDASGRFWLSSISGTPGATLEVELRDNTGVPMGSARAMNLVGTGIQEWIPFTLVYNPGGAALPAVASYASTLQFDLTYVF